MRRPAHQMSHVTSASTRPGVFSNATENVGAFSDPTDEVTGTGEPEEEAVGGSEEPWAYTEDTFQSEHNLERSELVKEKPGGEEKYASRKPWFEISASNDRASVPAFRASFVDRKE